MHSRKRLGKTVHTISLILLTRGKMTSIQSRESPASVNNCLSVPEMWYNREALHNKKKCKSVKTYRNIKQGSSHTCKRQLPKVN